jgi:hypothetical protein
MNESAPAYKKVNGQVRQLYMVLTPRALDYAHLAFESLFRNSAQVVNLTLITDSDDDRRALESEMSVRQLPKAHSWQIHSFADLDEREEAVFGRFERIRNFRRGHPCWRKITDPLLLSAPGEEMIILDPDIYFPNRFGFEETPDSGVQLMWQKPNCLFPTDVVRTAVSAGIRLAHHVDIGVAQWRNPVDLEWLDWLLGQIGPEGLPRNMHVEAIVWSALAMRIGGGYLDPEFWLCWRRSQYKRLLRRMGRSGLDILRREQLEGAKCFHAGGEAKWWLPQAHESGILNFNGNLIRSGRTLPFQEFTAADFYVQSAIKNVVRRLGYYAVFSQEYGPRTAAQ